MKKMTLLKNRKSKKGFSLLELLLVMGIIAALVVAAFIVYPKVQASQRSQAESNNIAAIQAGVKSLYSSTSNYTGLSTSVAIQAKIFPDNMLNGSKNLAYSSFGGDVALASENTGPTGALGSSFIITYYGVPPTECTKIMTAVAGNFYKAQVEAVIVKPVDGVLDVAETTRACSLNRKATTLIFTSI